MKCSLIRDLLPSFIEKDCSHTTRRIVDKHLVNCKDCKDAYELMKKPIKVEDSDEKTIAVEETIQTSKFWSRYYGNLILRGVIVFLFIYFIIVFLAST